MSDDSGGGLGLVDVLTCALAAVLLLFMVQAAQPPAKKGFGGAGTALTVGVADDTGPVLAVRFRLGGKVRTPAEARAEHPGLQLAAVDDGLESYTLFLRKDATFSPDDALLVYLHDLRRADPNAAVRLRVHLVGYKGVNGPRPPPKGSDLTPLRQPVVEVRLTEVADNAPEFKTWKLLPVSP